MTVQAPALEQTTRRLPDWLQRFFSFCVACYEHRAARYSILLLAVFALMAIFAPLVTWYGPFDAFYDQSMIGPSMDHLFGTDLAGRDIYSRVVYGARISMVIGLFAVPISAIIGSIIGLIAGYYGGRLDNVTMRFIDIMMAFPGILLAMVIVAVLGSGITNIIIAVGIGGIPNFARVARGSVMSIKQEVYVDAAKNVGCSDTRILFKHVLPNAFPAILVLASMSYGWALLSASGLSFIGLGATPPAAEWGAMLSDGRDVIWDAPWAAIFPGIAICCVVLASNLLGDALRDILDPKMRK